MARLSGPVCAELNLPSIGHLRDIIKLSKQVLHDSGRHRLLLAVSQATAEFHRAQGLTGCPIRVLYNGVDLGRFRPRPPTGWLHQELSLAPSAMLVGTVGQLILRKGQDTLAEAAASLATHGSITGNPLPELHYVIVGERASEKAETVLYEQRLHETFAQAGLRDRAHFLGRRENLHLLLPELTMLIHPARQEPLGRVLLEAGAVGLPIIATDVGGTREIFALQEPGKYCAVLTKPDQPMVLAEVIDVVASDRPDFLELGLAARDCITERFDVTTAATNLLKIYTELLSADPPATVL